MPAVVFERLDLRSALDAETRYVSNLLPPQIADRALAQDLDEGTRLLQSEILSGLHLQPSLIVSAIKWKHGRRPVSALPLPQRVAYRAAVDLLGEHLALAREDGDYQKFTDAPLTANAPFVVVTDLSNYYASINIDKICRSLLARSGEWHVVNWLHDFLQAISSGYGGLPQGSSASDRLGDTYGDVLLRSLYRRGLTAWRYADDFMIAAEDYRAAILALETFDEETRKLGLYVNERKTFTYKAETYKKHRGQPVEFFSQAWESARAKLTVFDMYSQASVEPEIDEVLLQAAADELDAWAEAVTLRDESAGSVRARIDLSIVLRILSKSSDMRAVPHISKLVSVEPQLTPGVANYLHGMSQENATAVDESIKQCLSDVALTHWQHLWLLHASSNPLRAPNVFWGTDVDSALRDWMIAQAASDNEVVASQAIVTLASYKDLAFSTWSNFAALATSYGRTYAAAAVHGISDNNNAPGDLVAESALDVAVATWAKSNV